MEDLRKNTTVFWITLGTGKYKYVIIYSWAGYKKMPKKVQIMIANGVTLES